MRLDFETTTAAGVVKTKKIQTMMIKVMVEVLHKMNTNLIQNLKYMNLIT